MPKILDTDYSNHLWANVLDKMQELFTTELDVYRTYISPSYQEKGNLSIRIWPMSAQADEVRGTTQWSRVNNIEISIYTKSKSDDDLFYKQYFQDFENVYQLLFDNLNKPSTLASTFHWIDGTVDNVTFNEMTDDEQEVDGLHVTRLEFSCTTIRNT